jgi:hypothetical protein
MVLLSVLSALSGYEYAERQWSERLATETTTRLEALHNVRESAQHQIARVEADAAAAVSAADRLRVAAERARRNCPAPAAGSGAASTAGDVLPDLLGRCGAVAAELAAATDRATTAGATCAAAYNALTGGQ